MQNKTIKRIKKADFEVKQQNAQTTTETRKPQNFWVTESLSAIKQAKAIEAKQFFKS